MQADLFNLSLSNSFERQAFQRAFFERKWSIRMDQLLGISLVLIVFFVLVFAWGVERGKAVSNREMIKMSQASLASGQSEPAAEAAQPIAAAPVAEVSLASESADVQIAAETHSEPLAAPAPAAPVLSEFASGSKYTIAHIVYLKKDLAAKEVERIKAKGVAARVIPSGRFFQVCVGGFLARKDANDAMKSLRQKNVVSGDAYIRNMPS